MALRLRIEDAESFDISTWCRPLYEGQRITVTEIDDTKDGRMCEDSRSFVAAYQRIHTGPIGTGQDIEALVWVECS